MEADFFQMLLFSGAVVLSVFVLMFWKKLFFKTHEHTCHQSCQHTKKPSAVDVSSLNAISGEDVQSTQLNLAKAYLEIDKRELARSLLKSVLEEGDVGQKEEAKRLMSELV